MLVFSLIVLVLGTTRTSGFPSHLSEVFLQGRKAVTETTAEHLAARSIDSESKCPFGKKDVAMGTVKRQLPGLVPPFDATVQYVSNQGAHAFVAPSGNDQRGPCKSILLRSWFDSEP